MGNDTNQTSHLSVEQFVRDDLYARLGAAADELEDIAAVLRQHADDLARVGDRSTAGIRLERLASTALQADLDRARRVDADEQ